MMKKLLTLTALIFAARAALAGEKKPARPYKSDPAVMTKVKALGARTGLKLGKFKVMPKDATKFGRYFSKGPGKRDYGNKMAYAPERGTALYCGGNHDSPHRLNDAWEFHLGSNTWHMLCPPGNDYRHFNNWMKKAKKDKAFREKQLPALARKWWNTCEMTEEGYLGAKRGKGPINPRHTWDGLTYDHHTKRMYWAVLDLSHSWKVKHYAKYTGQDEAKLVARIKPASTMYMYDPAKKRWFRQTGEGPFPRMHGMGGSLVYLPDLKKTIWYCAAQNRSPNDFGMWSYDAETNKWTELLSFKKVFSLVKSKQAPGSEVQCAYSAKHKKIVAVLNKGTFVYDVPGNSWKRGADNPGYAHDSHSVFAYDSNADAFLMVSKSRRHAKGEPWRLYAYDLKSDKWETVKVKGNGVPDDSKRKAWLTYAFAGYYDAGNNALVLYEGRYAKTWVYRHAPTKTK